MTQAEIDIDAKARILAVKKLVEDNPDEFEKNYHNYLKKLREGNKNGDTQRNDG